MTRATSLFRAARVRPARPTRRLAVLSLEDRVTPAVTFAGAPAVVPAANTTDLALGTVSGFAPIEPMISVNPTDPANLVVTSHNGIMISTNGGLTYPTAAIFQNPAGATSTGGDTDTQFDAAGRLYWSNLAGVGSEGVSVSRVNPATGAAVGATVNVSSADDDKEFLAADNNPASPFFGHLYVTWTRFGVSPPEVFFARSTDQGQTWSAPIQLSTPAESFVWPVDVGVAPNGDVYVAYHSQPGSLNPTTGTNGQTIVVRSTDGGLTFPQKTSAFAAGQNDISYNVQTDASGKFAGTQFWTQGSAQPWVLPDPVRPGNVYVAAVDDPNDVHGNGDDADLVFARSTDNGLTWTRSTIDAGPANSFQLFPSAAVDKFGNIVVAWYDNRRGLTNGAGRFLLDVMATYSTDGGLTWAPSFRVNDAANPFDPDVGAFNRFNGPPPTTRIGEYFGVALYGGTAHLAWNGSSTGHQVVYDSFPIAGGLTVTGDDAGVTDDAITVRRMAANPAYVEVVVNGTRQYAGLAAGLTGIAVNGGGGNDTLTVDFSNGVIAPPGGITFDGGIGTDTVVGPNAAGTWTVTGAGAGSLAAGGLNLTFGNVESLTGGTANDGFTFNAGGTLAGSIDGGAGTNTITGDNTGRTYTVNAANGGTIGGLLGGTFTRVQNLTGGTGSDTFTFASPGPLAGTVTGGAGTDTLVGDNTGRTYTISGAGSGTISGGLLAGFNNIENLTGGTGGDIFQFSTGGSLAGSIDGGTGAPNSLIGDNTARTFTISGANSGTLSTILTGAFSNIANLTGGTAGDTFTFVAAGGGSLTGTINGGNGTDTLNGDDAGRTFTVTAANGGTVGTILPAGFTSVENLNGGTGNDQFTFVTPGTLAGTVNGGGGTNSLTGDNGNRTYTITAANGGTIGTLLPAGFSNIENLTGGTANDQFTFTTGGTLAGSIDGGAGTDTVIGDNAVRTFTITAPNAGNISNVLTAGFVGIENLTGGTQNDTFQFATGGTLSGNINAGNGADDLIADDAGRTFVVTAQGSGTLAGLLGGTFQLVNNLIGGAGNDTFQFNVANGLAQSGGVGGNVDGKGGSDTLIGDNSAHTFAVNAVNGGTVAGLFPGTFANVENLTGGTAGDTFTFTAPGRLDGNIDDDGGTNTINGDNSGRTYTINAANGGTIGTLLGGTFANVQNLTGGSAADRFQFVTPGTLAGTIDGGNGNDTLACDDAARTFTVTGANTGTVSTILANPFVSIENLEGGAQGDTLAITFGGSLTGSFDGKAGTDGVDLSALLTAQSLAVTGLGGIDGFNVSGSPVAGVLLNINGLTSSAAIGNSLTGLNANTEWRLTGLNVGTYKDINSVRTMSITGFENLVGGNQIDLFVFANGGLLTGTAAGNLGTDTVQGDDGARTFAVTGAGAGTVSTVLTAGFTGIENLVGGSAGDTLVVSAGGTLAGSFDGKGGTDTADLSALAGQQIAVNATGLIDGFDTTGGTNVAGGLFNLNSLTGSLAGTTDRLTGLDVNSTWTVNAANGGLYGDDGSARSLTFASIENLTGGSATDILVVAATGSLGGAFDGKAGYDTADLSATAGQTPTVAAVGAADGYDLTGMTGVGGGLQNLQNIVGSAAGAADDLTGRNAAATWMVNAAGAGFYADASTRTLDFSRFESLSGGTDNDLLLMQAGGGLSGSFDGGLGTDTGDFSAQGAQQFAAAALGAADGFNVTGVPTVAGDLKNVDALVGSTAGTTDRLTGLGTTSTWTVTAANGGNYQDDASTRKLAFTQVENLTGGTANDLLLVKVGGSLLGSFDGGAGFDAADLSALPAVQKITINALGGKDGFNTTGGTTVTGGFQSVDKVVGGHAVSAVLGASDRLTNRDADGTFLVKAGADASVFTDVGSGRKLVFAGFEELFGGSQKDGFTVDFSAGVPVAAIGLTVNGLAGSDSLSAIGTAVRDGFALGVKVFKVNLKPIRYSNLEKLEAFGGAGSDVFNAPNVTMPSSVQLIQFFGQDGNDIATAAPTTGALLHLDGGAGTDTLNLLRGLARFVTPIPSKSAVSGTYFFTNRKPLEFISFEIRDIGIAQPQP
jgi:hypothetical protein